ncbi:hypothetical protein KP509_24G005500 [Ceratopteris richardii]|uniref:PPM-type phosphatase domain-containing protein n=1 Tax=Ceratopteris richardii TaxID=49495 RepID=A0A8T2RV80_CERRI|nr:hypothetical protein KP509_24G005500 [Ceratopteris richardii]
MYGNDAAIFDDERRGKNRKRRISYGFSLVKGRSKHQMEDHHVAQFRSFRQEHELGLFAIFDGHLGHSVAIYLQHHLFDNILSHPKFWSDPRVALTEAYEKTDSEIIQRTKELGRGGSTAVTAIVIDGQKLIVANVGDSRAVACRDDAAIQLTVDHEPGKEKVSIEGMGGFVSVIPASSSSLCCSRASADIYLQQLVSEQVVASSKAQSTLLCLQSQIRTKFGEHT